MAITVTQKFEPRPSSLGDNASVETTWIVAGTDDDIAAKYALRDATPVWYDGLIRNNLSIDIIGPDTWEGVVTYGRRQEDPQTGESSFSFDTEGGTQHITQSLQNIANYPGLAANYKGAIGVTHDNVEGVDITVPIYKFSETHYLSASLVTYSATIQRRRLERHHHGFFLSGKVLVYLDTRRPASGGTNDQFHLRRECQH